MKYGLRIVQTATVILAGTALGFLIPNSPQDSANHDLPRIIRINPVVPVGRYACINQSRAECQNRCESIRLKCASQIARVCGLPNMDNHAVRVCEAAKLSCDAARNRCSHSECSRVAESACPEEEQEEQEDENNDEESKEEEENRETENESGGPANEGDGGGGGGGGGGGPPSGPPNGPPDGPPNGPPDGPPNGPPDGPPNGPPDGPPNGPPDGPPNGPPDGPPNGPPDGPPNGPPGPPGPPFPPPPPPPPWPPICIGICIYGDPHLTSVDGLHFSIQAVGEFLAIESDALDTTIQARFKAWGSSGSASVTSAFAMRYKDTVLVVDVAQEHLIQIDGEPITLTEGIDGAFLHNSEIYLMKHASGAYQIDLPNRLMLRFTASNRITLGIKMPNYVGDPARGLFGSDDGNRSNEFGLRDGTIIPHENGKLSYEDMYSRFGNSWRISQEESLFIYADGETTETFTDLNYPARQLTIDDLSDEDRERAARICRAAGIPDPRLLENCIYDVGFTGDGSFADDYAGLVTASSQEIIRGPATLSAPERVEAGSTVTVEWTGPANKGDFISLAHLDQISGSQYETYDWAPQDGTPVELVAPGTPGDYELRYVIDDKRQIIARRIITVLAENASLSAPEAALAGSTVLIEWTGPANNRDFISLARPDQSGGNYETYAWVPEAGANVELVAPGTPGDYELRYVLNSDREIVARRSLRVLPTEAAILAPQEVNAGVPIEIEWTGPANNRDFISIARLDQETGSAYVTYDWVRAGEGSLTLTAPDEPGEYELRYVLQSDSVIIARQSITVR